MDSLGLILALVAEPWPGDDEKEGQEMMSPLEVIVFKTLHLPLLFSQIPGSSGGQRSPLSHRDLQMKVPPESPLPFVMTFLARDGEREQKE